jgi:hypothetical protein
MGPAAERSDLAGLRSQRADVHSALVDVEEAVATPLGSDDWADGVHDALVELAAAFERHIAATERREGLFDDVVRASPRLLKAVERLRDDHVVIRQSLADALVEVRGLRRWEAGSAEKLREMVVGVVARLARHRQAGADLVYEAYSVDIGGSE